MAKLPADLDLIQRSRRERVVDMARHEYEAKLGTLIGLVRAGYRSGERIAEVMGVSRSMAYAWISRAVEEGHLTREAGKRGNLTATTVGEYMVIVDEVDGALVPHRKK